MKWRRCPGAGPGGAQIGTCGAATVTPGRAHRRASVTRVGVVDDSQGSLPASRDRWWHQAKWQAFVAIGSTYLIIVFATAFSFIALPSIADDFRVTLKVVGWVVITESLLIAALLLPMGGVADAVGRKRVVTAGMAVFGLGAIATGLAQSFALLIAARVVLALGSALIQSVATGMLVAIFPPGERGLAIGGQTTAVAVGSAIAPLVGGIALQALGWRTPFLLLIILVALSLLAIRFLVVDDRADAASISRSFDPIGGVLSALAVVVLVLVINNPFELPWLSPVIVIGGLLAAGFVATFVRWELRVSRPMLEMRLFGIPVFRNAVIVRVLGFVAATANMLLLPIYLVSAREVSVSVAGVLISVLAVGMGLSAQVSGRVYDRLGPRLPSILGLLLQITAVLGFAFFDGSTPLPVVGIVAFLAGVAMALWNVPNNSAMLGATPPSAFAVGGAFTNVTRTVGTAIGQALTTAVVAGVMASKGFDIPLGELADSVGAGGAFFDGWQYAYLVAAGLSAAALPFALRLPPHSNTTSSSEEARIGGDGSIGGPGQGAKP